MLKPEESLLFCAIYMEQAISPWAWLWLNTTLPGVTHIIQSEVEIKASIFWFSLFKLYWAFGGGLKFKPSGGGTIL